MRLTRYLSFFICILCFTHLSLHFHLYTLIIIMLGCIYFMSRRQQHPFNFIFSFGGVGVGAQYNSAMIICVLLYMQYCLFIVLGNHVNHSKYTFVLLINSKQMILAQIKTTYYKCVKPETKCCNTCDNLDVTKNLHISIKILELNIEYRIKKKLLFKDVHYSVSK